MKSLSISRYLGVGLGVGIASFAIYHAANQHAPEHFAPNLTEFKALSTLDQTTNCPVSVAAVGDTVLVQYDSDGSDDNQIVLPATDELTAGELQLAPEMSLDAFDMSVAAQAALAKTDFEPAVEESQENSAVQLPMLEPLQSPVSAEKAVVSDNSVDKPRLHEIAGSTWRPNPFSGEDSNVSPDPISDLTDSIEIKSETPSSQFQNIANSASIPASTEELQKVEPTSQKNPVVGQTEDQAVAAQDWVPVNPALTASQSAIIPTNMGMNESVAQRAVHHIEYGKALARRGSTFAARQEFYSAMRILAQANDSVSGTNHFSASLREGILALKEAEDFMVNDAESRIGLNVSHVIETHHSALLTQDEAEYMNPAQAMQRYFAFGEQQLEVATGSNVVAAEALYCLGKLHTSRRIGRSRQDDWILRKRLFITGRLWRAIKTITAAQMSWGSCWLAAVNCTKPKTC